MTPPKISVIVPVYKAEKYLHRCVDSILAQTFTDFEVLLIDDGSPDRSGEICDEYAQKDSRVRVFHKENGGVSSARQCGIDNAQGKYTIHADPDDWVEPNMLEELYAKAEEDDADMVICDFFFHKQQIIYKKQTPKNLAVKSLLRQYLAQELHGSMWNKLIRKEVYITYNVNFNLNMTLWEDLYVICCMLQHPIKVAYLNNAYYHYDFSINDNSLVRTATEKGLWSINYFITYFSDKLLINDYHEEFYRLKLHAKKIAFVSGLRKGKELNKMYPEIDKEIIMKYKFRPFLNYCLALYLSGKLPYLCAFNICKIYMKIRGYSSAGR